MLIDFIAFSFFAVGLGIATVKVFERGATTTSCSGVYVTEQSGAACWLAHTIRSYLISSR